MSNRVFGDNDEWTSVAAAISRDAYDALGEIFSKWTKLGYSPREISYIIMTDAFELGLKELAKKKKDE